MRTRLTPAESLLLRYDCPTLLTLANAIWRVRPGNGWVTNSGRGFTPLFVVE